MMYKFVVAAAALVAVVNAQSSTVTASSTASQAMPAVATQGFNIGNVTSTDKRNWCNAQINTCTDMCLGHYQTNNCDDSTLVYTCLCYNGTVPDSTSFIQTIPFFECEATYSQCIANNPNDQQAQSTCTANEQCPTRNATAERYPNGVSSASSSSTSTASATGGQTSSASASAASSTSSHAAGTSVSPASTGAFVALLFAVCRLVL